MSGDPSSLPGSGPTISVVVNTCDRAPELRTLLYALEHQSYRDFEVVVVVGPTRDDTPEMLQEEFADRVVVARCPHFNLCCSRNAGLTHAAGEIVAFIDDDAVPSRTWLGQLAAGYLADPEAAGVGGRTYQIHPGTGDLQFLSGRVSVVAEQRDVRWNPEEGIASETPARFWFPRFHGTNMSYRREALVAINGFDERFEYLFDDADVAVRLALAGRRLVQSRQAVVYHVPTSGRNRGPDSLYDLNWYCWLRSRLYFALKNGRGTVGWRRTLGAVGEHVSWFYTSVRQLLNEGKVSPELYRKARKQLHRGSVVGVLQGLFASRRIPADVVPVDRPLRPFPRPEPAKIPAILPLGLARDEKVTPMATDPLRVCLLSAGYPPRSTEGVARSTHTLARGLFELGHEVHVVTLGDRHRVCFEDGAYVHAIRAPAVGRYRRLAASGFENLNAWLNYSHAAYDEVRTLVQNHEIQLVDSPLWNLDGLVTAVAGTVPVAVRVVTAMKQIAGYHEQPSRENLLLGDLEGELLRRAAAIISNTEASARTIEEIYGLDLDATVHGVALYGMVPAPDEEVVAPSGEAGAETTVLYVGRLEKRKGIPDLFAAIPEVLRRRPRTRFLIAGSDNSHEDGFRDRHRMDYPTWFRKQYPRLSDRVEFPGFVDEDRLEGLYRDCDVFVAPSLYESFGLIYLEAMNQARPVVGCRAGGPQEVIADGETGLLVPPQDPESLAEAILRLVADPGRRREMGRAGRARLLERFTHTAMAAAFVEIYRRALGLSGSPG